VSDLFFIASKTLGMVARAETWMAFCLTLAMIALWRGRLRGARVWGTAGFVLVAGLTVFPLGDPLLRRLEAQYPVNPPLTKVDGIIVLGGAEDIAPYRLWGDAALNDAGERAIAGAELARRFPGAKLIYTGGTAGLMSNKAPGDPSAIMRAIWLRLGVPEAQIVTEGLSRNTSENARFTRDQLQPKPGQVYVLVTSAFHMPRSMETFSRAGWSDLVAWPVDFRSGDSWGWRLDEHLSDLDVALKEYLGLLAYRVAGK
jgi:uncharacterized SAM-binding protein YcdF (DUF218 family)